MMKKGNALTPEDMDQSLHNKQLNPLDLKLLFQSLTDVVFPAVGDQQKLIAMYCEGMTDIGQLNRYLEPLVSYLNNESVPQTTPLPPIMKIQHTKQMIELTFSGYLIFYRNKDTCFHGVNLANIPQRKPEESKTELSIKGPRDAFTEQLHTNIALLRKRIKSEALCNETYIIGTLSQTRVSLLYLNNKADPGVIHEVRTRLQHIKTESLISSGRLEQWISDRTFSLFPLVDYISRPDFALNSLLLGRFVLLVDGSPISLIGPINLFALLKSPEDTHFPYYIILFQRIIRFLGLFIAMFVPALYLAITSVNLDQLPFTLLATIFQARKGLPFSLTLEALLILLLFELLREAVVRMPAPVGQTISIVGGLVIGDAAIRAGLSSPTMIVIIATSVVASYTLVNQSLTGTVTIIRLYCLLVSIYLGVYGFILSFLSVIVYLSKLESFKMAYLEPVVSLRFKPLLYKIPYLHKWIQSRTFFNERNKS